MDGGVGHKAWAPEGVEGRSQSSWNIRGFVAKLQIDLAAVAEDDKRDGYVQEINSAATAI